MEFTRVIAANQPTDQFESIPLTTAQIESIITSGKSAPIAENLQDSFHIAAIRSERAYENLADHVNELPEPLQAELRAGGPVLFIVSVKDDEQTKESMYLYAGMIMANMQLQATSWLLGYSFSSDQGYVKFAEDKKQKQWLGIPDGFTPVQILRVGYTTDIVEARRPNLSEVFTQIIK